MAQKNDVMEANASIEELKEKESATVPENDALDEAEVEKPKGKGKGKRDPVEEMVWVELFKDGDRYSDDVVVTINGKNYQIQRGVPVQIPRKVKEVLDNAQRQSNEAIRVSEAAQDTYKEFEKRL